MRGWPIFCFRSSNLKHTKGRATARNPAFFVSAYLGKSVTQYERSFINSELSVLLSALEAGNDELIYLAVERIIGLCQRKEPAAQPLTVHLG